MTAGARLATFGLVLLAAFALAFGVGAAMDDGEPSGDVRDELDHVELHEDGGEDT